ncbi:MAG: 2Fe-2S iron-sulfur cluster-binding protein [Myxococcota bacterium]|nr:2Fe-2S iron-sulfur cluster-binding protein [Myxococcota bacterium]
MGIRERARRRIRELIGRRNEKSNASSTDSEVHHKSEVQEESRKENYLNGQVRERRNVSPTRPTQTTDSIDENIKVETVTPSTSPQLQKSSTEPQKHTTPVKQDNDVPVFQVTAQENAEYESDYVSNDAPTRLAHHAATVDSNTTFKVTVQVPDGEPLSFDCLEGEFVLDAADRSGLELPYSCRSGGCLCCAARVVSGKVQQAEQYVLEPDHLNQGYVLLCCCTIESDSQFVGHQEDNID